MPQSFDLGSIKPVDLRDIFHNEAHDFTPWLAKEENLRILSDEIGVDIKLNQVEAEVGDFNVDILAEEEGSSKKIIIENQLEATDHDHLGKIITYASGHDAEIIIWIFSEIREEHRQAIDWLNEHTDEDIAFFALQMELWQIDDSKPAPKFNIIASPNEWTKAIRGGSSAGDYTETKLRQLAFWNQFKVYVRKKDQRIRLQTPRPQHWYDVSMGSAEAHISLTVNTRDNTIGCELYINNNKELFHYLEEDKVALEHELGSTLEFIEASVASRIKMTKGQADIISGDDYQEYYSWLYENTIKFQTIFGARIRAFMDRQG